MVGKVSYQKSNAYAMLTYLDAVLTDSDSGSTFQIGLVLSEYKIDPNPSG